MTIVSGKKVAVLRRNGLGDLLCTIPLVKELNAQGASVTLFVDERNAPLVPYLREIEDWRIFPAKGNKYWNVLSTALAHRGAYDLAISAKTSPMKLNNCFLFALNASTRIAYVDQKWHRRLINAPVVYKKELEGFHQAVKALKLIDPTIDQVSFDLYPKIRSPKGERRLLISASTTSANSRPPLDWYAHIVNQFCKRHDLEVSIVSMWADKERAQKLSSRLTVPNEVQIPENFDAFIELLRGCTIAFVGDGGAAHLCAAMGKGVVAVYGGVNPVNWAPLGVFVKTLFSPTVVGEIETQHVHSALEEIYERRKSLCV